MTHRALGLLLALLASQASAEIYSEVDASGNRVFTDRPSAGSARAVPVKPSNVMPLTVPVVHAPPTHTVRLKHVIYTALHIDSPAPQTTVRGAGDVTVTLSSVPELALGHAYRLLIDGAPVSAPSGATSVELSNLDRGEHQLSAEIIDADGNSIIQSERQPLYVHRMSLSQKRMVQPCQKGDYGVRPECPMSDKPPEPRKRFLGLF
ncbi:DUF4124 domain-containing protein [Pseudomonas sp. Marseille-QA0892]